MAGSFLNVVIYRLDTGESIIKKRSHCIKCGHELAWYELVPVVSFLIQKGKCRACEASISLQYPTVEITTGLLFLLIFNQLLISGFLNTSYYLIIASLLIVIAVFDLKHFLIPDKIVYPAIVLVAFYKFFEFLAPNNWGFSGNVSPLYIPLLTALFASAFFAAIFFISRGKWLGFGDVKLAFLIALFLSWPKILVALFAGFILGGIIGIGLIAIHKKTMKSQVPFGPFLVAGTFIAMFFGDWILNWYIALL